MKKAFYINSALILVIGVFFLAVGHLMTPVACAAEPVELIVWGEGGPSGGSGHFWKKAMQEFEKTHPGIKIKYETPMEGLDISQELQKLRIALQYGGPNVVMSNAMGQSFKELLKTKHVLSLDEAYKKYGWDKRIYSNAQDAVTFDNIRWGIPIIIEVVGNFYNKDVFEKLGLSPPSTFDQHMAILGKLTKAGYYGTAIGLKAGWPSAFIASEYAYISAGSEYIEVMKGEKKWVDSKGLLKAIEVYKEIVDKGYSNPFVTGIDFNQARDMFFTAKAATILEGPWFIRQILITKPDFKAGFYGIPPINPDTDIMTLGGVGSTLLVTTDTKGKQREAAFELIDFIMSPETATSKAIELGEITPVDFPLTAEMPEMTRDFATTINKYGRQIGYWPVYHLPQSLFRKFNSVIQGMMMGKLTPMQVLEEMDKAREEYNRKQG